MSNTNDSGNLTALYRVVGKIEGMLAQFLGFQQEQNRRITDAETKLEQHDNRIGALETHKARFLGYIAGATAVLSAVVIATAWLADKVWK